MGKIEKEALVQDFRQMLDEHWAYEHGAEEEGLVDCAGAFVYAYRKHNEVIPHGSNRIARTAVDEKLPVIEARAGMAAFKAKEPGEEGYSLPDGYQPGGKYYDGDLNDYYHIGLVDTDGFHVLNARSKEDGFVSSPITDGWDYVARLKKVVYEVAEPEPEPEPKATQYRVVGGALNLRRKPKAHALAIRSLREGEIVEDQEDTFGEWMHVQAGRETGYVMRQYLEPVGSGQEPSGDAQYIRFPEDKWDAFVDAVCKLMEAAEVTEGVD